MFLPRAQAEVINLIKDTFDNTYTYYYDYELDRPRYLIASRYVFGDNVAYCLEMGKPIESLIYNVTNSFDELNINKSDMDYIKLVSYYGYDYPGHQTDKYYMATQELIWRRLGEPSMAWTIGLTPNHYYDLTNEKKEINSLISSHNIKPSFDGNTYDFFGEEIILEDSNNVLSMYEILSDDAYIEDNKLIIKESFSGDVIKLKKHVYKTNNFLLYTSGNSQKMMSVGMVDMPSSTININTLNGSVSIKKYDSETMSDKPVGSASLEGAVYGLYDDVGILIDTFITGEKEKIDGLVPGNYYVKEISASKGYLIDNNIYDFSITKEDLNVSLTLYEDVIKRKVDLFKVFSSDSTGILVSENNIRFDIYNSDNIFIDYVITDDDGYANIILPYGKYIFKQVNSTPGYYKVDDFTVNIDSFDKRPIYKLLSDSIIKSKVKVIKKDIDTNDNIVDSNIKFKIYDVDKKEYVSFKIDYPESSIIDVFEINSDGYFITPFELEYGNYILYEVDDDMNGYLYNHKGVSFVIDENSNFIKDGDDLILEISFYNKKVKGNINIIKYGENIEYIDDSYFYKNVLLKDVSFNLYASLDIYENNKLIYNKDDLIYECITDDKGECYIDNLPLGSYYLKEVMSSNNNSIDDSVYYIDLVYKDQYTANVSYELSVNNYIDKGKLVINKYETNTNIGLLNTLIEIHNFDGKIVYKGYTDVEGKIVIEDLPYGKYYISEIEASTGYRLLEDNIYFEMNEEEKVIDIYNDRIEVPNTGIDIGTRNICIILCVFLAIIFIILFYENKKIIVCSIVVILIGFGYLGLYFYRYYTDLYNNKTAYEAFIAHDDNVVVEDRYRYNSLLEIPRVKLKRGILDINDDYNDVKYNIELVYENSNAIILASHNGNNYNSYFGRLNMLEYGDEIYYYKDNMVYKYVYSDSYKIRKNGYADIYYDKDKRAIILCTCIDDDDSGQMIYIGYLEEIREY